MSKVLKKEDLKDTLKRCSCCGDVLFASVEDKESQFGAFRNQNGWYYQAWCRSCYREKAKYYTSKAKTEYILEQIRLKRELERAEREWTVYKITLDIEKFDSSVRKKWRRIHRKYFYIGITKQKVENRWNEHLYDLKRGKHSNYFLNCLYTNIRELYKEMSEDEFFNYFKSDIIKFEVIMTLDKSLTESQVKIYEAFEVKRLEHNIRINNSKEYMKVLRNNKNYKQSQLIVSCREMITNIEHCNSNIRYKKEIDDNKKDKKNTPSLATKRI